MTDFTDLRQLTFRDGSRWVPAHIANLLEGVETFKLTYDEALRVANKRMTDSYVVDQMNAVIQGHFRRH